MRRCPPLPPPSPAHIGAGSLQIHTIPPLSTPATSISFHRHHPKRTGRRGQGREGARQSSRDEPSPLSSRGTARHRQAPLGAAPPRRHAGAPGDLEWPSAACAARGSPLAGKHPLSTQRGKGSQGGSGTRPRRRRLASSRASGRGQGQDQNSAHIFLESRRRKIEFREWP